MRSFQNTFLSTLLLLSGITLNLTYAENTLPSQLFEKRLDNIKSQSNREKLHSLFDLYWDWRMAENPDEATYLGQPGKHDVWPDLSKEAIKRHVQFLSQLLEPVGTVPIEELTDDDSVNLNIFKRTIEEELQSFQFGNHYLLVNQMHGIHLNIPLTIGLMPAKTLADYENILSRLKSIPSFFQQIADLLDEGVSSGITPPRIAIRKVPEQILNLMVDSPLDSPLLVAFHNFPPDFREEQKLHFQRDAELAYQQKVLPALQDFYVYFTKNYLPYCRKSIAFSDLPNGTEWYEFMVKSSTTTDLTPQQIHSMGMNEVKRIHGEMVALIESIGFNGTFEAFLHFLKTDPQFFYDTRDDLLQGYQSLTRHIQAKLPLLFGKLPSLPFEVVPVPSYSEESQGTAYYCHGSLKDQRPGQFFINTSFPSHRAKWEMVPLSLHEAVPGHHLQITIAQELENIPVFRKHGNFTAYIEGWGLYAESLGNELELYQDPYAKFGRLTYEMLRAIRLVVDTGMHAMGWSRDDAIGFFKQYLCMSDHEITTEVDRYIVLPGQALAYKIGELKIQQMRQFAAQQLGEQFDIREFHDAWLQLGALPLDIAEQQIIQWVKNKSPHFAIK